MEITPIGYLLIPVGLVAAFLPWKKPLFYLLIFFAPFTATAVINTSATGLSPSYFFGILFMIRFIIKAFSTKSPISYIRSQSTILLLFAIFVLVALVSIWAIPLYGPIPIIKASGQEGQLQQGVDNILQFLYLIYIFGLISSIGLSKLQPKDLHQVLRVILLAAIFVALWGWLQLFLFSVHIPYPEFIFNNSNGVAQNSGQQVIGLGLKRMNSVAPEPSYFGRYLTIPTFISFYCIYNKGFLLRSRQAVILATFFSITALVSTSTSAIISFGGGIFIFLFLLLKNRKSAHLYGGNTKQIKKIFFIAVLILILLPAILFAFATLFLHYSIEDINILLQQILFNKLDSHSGEIRTGNAVVGFQLFLVSPLLGIGWGSNRTNELTSQLLSTTGLIGVFSFILAHFVLFKSNTALIRYLGKLGYPLLSAYPEVLLIALSVRLFSKIVSEPSLIPLDYWILVGLMIATLRWVASVRSKPEAEQQLPVNLRRDVKDSLV
jgi:hypothetical protein